MDKPEFVEITATIGFTDNNGNLVKMVTVIDFEDAVRDILNKIEKEKGDG